MFRLFLVTTTLLSPIVLLMFSGCSVLQVEETYLFVPKTVSAPEKKSPPPQKIRRAMIPEKETEREVEKEPEEAKKPEVEIPEKAQKPEEPEKPELFIPEVIPPGKKISRLPYKARAFGLVVPFIDLCIEAEKEEEELDWGITPWLFKGSDGQ